MRVVSIGCAVLVATCLTGCATRSPAALPDTSTLTVGVSTSGERLGGLLFTVEVDSGAITAPIKAVNGVFTARNLRVGDHAIRLTDLPSRCHVDGKPDRHVTLAAQRTAAVRFVVRCS